MGNRNVESHFAKRVRERIGINPGPLIRDLVMAISKKHDFVEYAGKTPDGLRVYRFRVEQGTFFALYSPKTGMLVTLYEQGWLLKRGKKRPKRLN